MPWVRAVATRSASPALASQAENASRSIGAAENPVDSSCRAHKANAMNNDSIIPSRHNKADSRWVR